MLKAGYLVQGLFKVDIFGSHLPYGNKCCRSSLEAVSAHHQPRLETTHGIEEGGKRNLSACTMCGSQPCGS